MSRPKPTLTANFQISFMAVQMAVLEMDEQGQVQLPEEFLVQLGAVEGDVFCCAVDGNRVVLTLQSSTSHPEGPKP